MKSIKTLLVFAILPLFSFAQTAQENGTAFIQKFFEKNYKEANAFFDESVNAQITPELLEKTETALQQQLGDYKKTIEVNEEQEAPYKTLYYYSEFDKTKLDIKLVFNDKNKMVGFFLVPHKEFDKKKVK